MKPVLILTNTRTGKSKQLGISLSVGKSPEGNLMIIAATGELDDHYYNQITISVPVEMIPK